MEWKRIDSAVGFVAGLALVLVGSGAVLGRWEAAPKSTSVAEQGRHHIHQLPAVPEVASGSCAAELAAYAIALNRLEDAQNAADAAYEAWVACETVVPEEEEVLNSTELGDWEAHKMRTINATKTIVE